MLHELSWPSLQIRRKISRLQIFTILNHQLAIFIPSYYLPSMRADLSNTPQLDYSVHPSIQNLEFTTHGIQLLLEKLEPTKAPGPDQIPTKVIKFCANAIAPVLQIIYTQSLQQATHKNDHQLISPLYIFKKGNRSTPANYQPISLTSVLCKVMEHIIFHHIMLFFTSQNILNPLQHGFRPNHSCQTQLIDFIDEIQRSMNDRQQTDLIFIDFSKAFDTVPHIRLLNKLKFHGIRRPLHHRISAWLTRKEQRVVVNGKSSNATPVKLGGNSIRPPYVSRLYQ